MSCESEYVDFNTGSNASVSLEAGTLPDNFCHTSFQETFNTFVANTRASLDGSYSTFLYGPTEPATEDRDKPWLKIDSSSCNPVGWYVWRVNPGAWVKADYDLEELQQVSDWMKTSNVANGSFEVVTASGGVVNWTFTAQGSGTGAITTTAAEVHHGARAFKIEGNGTGGGNLVGDFYIPIKDTKSLTFKFSHISDTGTTRNIAKIKFYNSDQVYLAEDVAYDSSASPTSWTDEELTVSVPSGARFAVVEFIGADSSYASSGTWTIDDVSLEEASGAAAASSSPFGTNIVVLDTPGTSNWPVPSGVTTVVVEMWGAGGGGAFPTASGNPGSGGGSGAYVKHVQSVVPGDSISYTVGAGGVQGDATPTAATAGGDTVFGTITSGGGGAGLTAASGIVNGGAGGVASGSPTFSIQGETGHPDSHNASHGTVGKSGGHTPLGGSGGEPALGQQDGLAPGGGGSGGKFSNPLFAAGDGANGLIIITY